MGTVWTAEIYTSALQRYVQKCHENDCTLLANSVRSGCIPTFRVLCVQGTASSLETPRPVKLRLHERRRDQARRSLCPWRLLKPIHS